VRVGFFTIRMRKGFGVDLVVDQWARRLCDDGHSVRVYCFDTDSDTYKGAPYAIVPLHLENDQANRVLQVFEADATNTLRKLKSDLGQSGKLDLALPASFPFYGAGKVLGCPSIHLHFGNPPTTGLPAAARLNRAYLDISDAGHLRRAGKILAISKFLADGLPREAKPKAIVIYPGGDHLPKPGAYARNLMRSRLELDDSRVMLFSISRLDYKSHPYKGVMELAQVAAKLKEGGAPVELVLAGMGRADQIASLKQTGAIIVEAPDWNELAQLYAAADIFVSLSRWEGFGLPVAEAAFAGLPTVALNVAAHRENAVSCPAESDLDAARIIGELASSTELRKQKGEEARSLAARFTWNESREKFGLLAAETARAG